MNKTSLASDIGQLIKYGSISGIPRVVKSTHEYLQSNLNILDAELFGYLDFDQSLRQDEEKSQFKINDPILKKKILTIKEVDVLLKLDLNWNFNFEEVITEKSLRKLPVVSLIYDVLPITHPLFFPESIGPDVFIRVLKGILSISDHLIFNSRSTYLDFLNLDIPFLGEIYIFPLGAFTPPPPLATSTLASSNPAQQTNTIVYVSTIEPRKGHDDTLDAFQELINSGEDWRLILVGRHGWDCFELVNRIQTHPEFGKRLIWLNSITDEELASIYVTATVAIVPSHAEGFGLNLEEALNQHVPVVARDIPVFRERPYENVYYFDGIETKLSQMIRVASSYGWKNTHEKTRQLGDFGKDMKDLVDQIIKELRTHKK